jgi:hypothetical protein
MNWHRARLGGLLAALVVLVACSPASSPRARQESSPAVPTSSPVAFLPGASPRASASPAPLPTAQTAVETVATARPTAAPSPSAAPTIPLAWSAPRTIDEGECRGLSALLDRAGTAHLAMICGDDIVAFTSSDRAGWTGTRLEAPAGQDYVNAQLSADDGRVHLAATAVEGTDGGCGEPGLQGPTVSVRSRSLDGGRWSAPMKAGEPGDTLMSLRASDGALHMTVKDDAGGVHHVARSASGATRTRIPRADETSLRVGDDGRARIAYTTRDEIRLARVDDGRLTTWRVATNTDQSHGGPGSEFVEPQLLLGDGDRAWIGWTRTFMGCTVPESGPSEGTYVATNAGGVWRPQRISPAEGTNSFALDPDASRMHVLVGGRDLEYLVGKVGGTWRTVPIGPLDAPSEVILRLDPRSGEPVVFANTSEDGLVVMDRR